MRSRYRPLSRTFALLTGLTWILVVFGALVRAKGAGLSCPDWPLCFGEWIPRLDFGVMLEWGHRTLAGFIGLSLVALLLWARSLPRARKVLGWLSPFSIVLLLVQAGLGGLTVLELLASWTVTLHLLCGNLFCLTLLWMTLRLRTLHQAPRPLPSLSHGEKKLLVLAALLLLAQMTYGGLVSSQHAGFACQEWPTCQGDVWFPAFTGLIGLQVIHRLLAYALALTLGVMAWRFRGRGHLGRLSLAAAVVVLIQVVLGVLNVLWYVPVEITALHSAGAAGLVLILAALFHEVSRRTRKGADGHPRHETA